MTLVIAMTALGMAALIATVDTVMMVALVLFLALMGLGLWRHPRAD